MTPAGRRSRLATPLSTVQVSLTKSSTIAQRISSSMSLRIIPSVSLVITPTVENGWFVRPNAGCCAREALDYFDGEE